MWWVGIVYAPAYLQNMSRGKYAQRLEPQCHLSCPVLKNEDTSICASYRGTNLLLIAYKVLTCILCELLKALVKTLIGPYQCSFRPGKSTISQIFTLCQILQKTHERQVYPRHLFVDYKTAFDSTVNDCVFTATSKLGIPTKLLNAEWRCVIPAAPLR